MVRLGHKVLSWFQSYSRVGTTQTFLNLGEISVKNVQSLSTRVDRSWLRLSNRLCPKLRDGISSVVKNQCALPIILRGFSSSCKKCPIPRCPVRKCKKVTKKVPRRRPNCRRKKCPPCKVYKKPLEKDKCAKKKKPPCPDKKAILAAKERRKCLRKKKPRCPDKKKILADRERRKCIRKKKPRCPMKKKKKKCGYKRPECPKPKSCNQKKIGSDAIKPLFMEKCDKPKKARCPPKPSDCAPLKKTVYEKRKDDWRPKPFGTCRAECKPRCPMIRNCRKAARAERERRKKQKKKDYCPQCPKPKCPNPRCRHIKGPK